MESDTIFTFLFPGVFLKQFDNVKVNSNRLYMTFLYKLILTLNISIIYKC